MRKDADGNTEKNILYAIKDQKYNIKIVTNQFGVEIKRETSLNFPKSEYAVIFSHSCSLEYSYSCN